MKPFLERGVLYNAPQQEIVMMLLLCISSLLFAQSTDSEEKAQTLDFEEVYLNGELKRPSGTLVNERPKANFPPLVDLRQHFETELVQSVQAVK